MARSLGQLYHSEVRARMPKSVKNTTDKILSKSAKATKKLRDKEEIQRHGKAWTASVKKSIGKNLKV